MSKASETLYKTQFLSAEELLYGGGLTHNIELPEQVLWPGGLSHQGSIEPGSTHQDGTTRQVLLRPLNVATLTLITRAAQDNAGLVPLLMIKEALVEPLMSLKQIQKMHVGLVHFLVNQINRISGLALDDDALDEALNSSLVQTQLLLAQHFGWTPEQVMGLSPGQIAVYLAGIDRFRELEESDAATQSDQEPR